jgi:hypothetical protein
LTESVPNLGGAILEFDRGGPSLQHFLNGWLVEGGTILEVQLDGGGWLPLRYEARWVEDDGDGHTGLFPRWHLVLVTRDGQADVELHDLPPATVMRWPEP